MYVFQTRPNLELENSQLQVEFTLALSCLAERESVGNCAKNQAPRAYL
jgi:hypothetical protein